jgi:hypothetical protein
MHTTTILETAREIPVVDHADIIVCGGGPAGVAAALSAARAGARCILLEQHGCLGGIWTSGLMPWFLDANDKAGIMQEIIDELVLRGARGANSDGRPNKAYDVEELKLLLDDLCAKAGVSVHLHTRVCAAQLLDGRLSHVITESYSGRRAFAAKQFIDCTGDGSLGALAGNGYDLGHPETRLTQPMSMIALLCGIRRQDIKEYYRDQESDGWAPPKERLRAVMEQGGHSPSYAHPTLFPVREDLFIMMANHEYQVSALSSEDISAATIRSRREVMALVAGLRAQGGIWRDVRVVATGAQIGIREGRRLHGQYSVTLDDMGSGARFDDAVCRVHFGVDVHATDPNKGKSIEAAPLRSQPYDIPLRSLIAKDVAGLFMAGRCISGDFWAHSSYRVTGNAVAMGEAIGKHAAALCRN